MELLNEEQRYAFDAIIAGRSVFLTGPGGTGKSFLLQTLYSCYKARTGKVMAVTALTGCAALLLGPWAKTLHSWAGIGLGKAPAEAAARSIGADARKRKRWRSTNCLVIDEVSMLTPYLLEYLDVIARAVRKCDRPMGGLQIVFVGDFYQLPPVMKAAEAAALAPGAAERTFAFESPLWSKLASETIELRQIVRQKDPAFQKILNEARVGELSAESYAALEARKTMEWKRQEIKPTLLFTKNTDVATINETQLTKLNTGEVKFQAKTTAPPRMPADIVQMLVEKLDKDAPYEPELTLKERAQVMLLVNQDPEAGLVNGSRGVVTGFSPMDGAPLVKFLHGPPFPVKVLPAEWKSDADNEEDAVVRTQVPLRLAYAITIHKCVSEDTLLSMPGRGLVAIQTLAHRSQESNTVSSPAEPMVVTGLSESKHIIEVYKGGVEDALRFTTTFGYELTTSTRHPLLVFNQNTLSFEWKVAPTITKEDHIILKRGVQVEGNYYSFKGLAFTPPFKREIRVPTYLNEDVAYFLGVMLGDGCINEDNYRFDLTAIDLDILDHIVDILKEQFGIVLQTHVAKERVSHTETIFFYSKQLVELLRYIGYNFQKAEKKQVPDVILRSPLSVQKALIQGLYDTDGGVAKHILNFTTTSEVMGHQVQQILLNIGIPVSRVMMRDENPEKNWKKVYRLNMSGSSSRKFMNMVGFRCGRKLAMAADAIHTNDTHSRKDTKSQSFEVPNGNAMIQNLRNEMRDGLKRIKSSDITPNGSKIMTSIIHNKQKLRCEQLSYIISEIRDIEQYPTGKVLRFMEENGILIDTIKSIEKISGIQMYDIGVKPQNTSGLLPDGHDFIGNGFVNHNCQGSTVDSTLIDVGPSTFEYGQAYVALSRARSLDSVFVFEIHPRAFRAHPAVKAFYAAEEVRGAALRAARQAEQAAEPAAPAEDAASDPVATTSTALEGILRQFEHVPGRPVQVTKVDTSSGDPR